MISTSSKKSFKSRGIIFLIVINIVLLFLFIWQALKSSAQHLQASQNVMRDYSSMAAQQFIRKFKGQMGYWAFHDLSLKLNDNVDSIQSNIKDYYSIPNNELNTQQISVRNGIQSIYVYTELDHNIDWMHGNHLNLNSEQIHFEKIVSEKPFHVFHPDNQNGDMTWVFFPSENNKYLLVVFKQEFVKSILDINKGLSELLPPVLANKINEQGNIFIQINTPNNQKPFYQIGKNNNPYILSETTIGDDYGGLFQGYKVYSAIDDSLASRLIIGGLPHYQIPKLILLIIATLIILLISLWVYKREKQLAQLRSQFVARVSHELRTPLTQIRMFSETLLFNRVNDPKTINKYLNIINRESIRLTQLVNNILNKHQVDQETIPVKFVNLNLKQEISSIKEFLQQILDRNMMNIIINVRENIEIHTDEYLFKQIIINVIDNAIKYGPDGQFIKITCNKKDGYYCLSISDQGPGIPENKQKIIWQNYQRLERDELKGINGTGIGLSIIAENLKAINGYCEQKNCKSGGACFELYLPIRQE